MFTPRPTAPAPLPEATPVAFAVLRTAQFCQHCSTLHESTQVMLRCELPARHGLGKPVTQMRRLDGAPQWNLPVETRTLETRNIPFCHECFDSVDLSHLPLPPQQDTRVLSSARAAEQTPKASTTPRKPSTDDLLDML